MDTAHNNILVYAGGASEWQDRGLSSDECTVLLLTDTGFVPVDTYPAENMGDPLTLSSFLNYGFDFFPADSYSLIPVSYTHLDVYKRQPHLHHRLLRLCCGGVCPVPAVLSGIVRAAGGCGFCNKILALAGYLGIDLRLSPLYKILHIKNSANPGTVFWYSISIHLPLSDRITGIQLITSALLGDEFIVVAALDDAALFQNHDAVTVLDSRKSVGDDESGSSFHQLIPVSYTHLVNTGEDS